MKDEERVDDNRTEILIVEDSLTQAMELEYLLEQNNYTVFLTHSGPQALEFIGSHRPSIVISDIVMPQMDGYELCRRIKENKSTRDISLILLTSLSETRDVIKGLQCGADKFFTKPYDEKLLLSAIQELTRSAHLAGEERERRVMEISYEGQSFLIDSDRRQIVNLLISTYEAAVRKNNELLELRDELRMLNRSLEDKIRERTIDLQAKNEELNNISQQLWHAAKLATMGELVASIAHELNNPLAVVGLRVESLLENTEEGDRTNRELQIISHEVERMGKLICNLLQFSRRGTHQVSTLDIKDEIEKTLELVKYRMRKQNISIQEISGPDVSSIHADREKLRQLFLNIFTNANDAMPDGGTLTIRVHNRQSETRAQEGGGINVPSVAIEIEDTGVGIPTEAISRITEPFFTTKPEGEGTGLGLAICKRIVDEHKGTFAIMNSSVPGGGVLVRVILPYFAP